MVDSSGDLYPALPIFECEALPLSSLTRYHSVVVIHNLLPLVKELQSFLYGTARKNITEEVLGFLGATMQQLIFLLLLACTFAFATVPGLRYMHVVFCPLGYYFITVSRGPSIVISIPMTWMFSTLRSEWRTHSLQYASAASWTAEEVHSKYPERNSLFSIFR